VERVDYTALGENVNLASRLEGLNKYLGTDCVLSGATAAQVGKSMVTRRLGWFQLKGFDKSVEVFELVDWPAQAEASRPWREAFEQALADFESRNLLDAMGGFQRVLELRPDDGPSKLYLTRIAELSEQTLPDAWSTHTIVREK
jgi:adenylate cyclase